MAIVLGWAAFGLMLGLIGLEVRDP
jgi:hypothetical protein